MITHNTEAIVYYGDRSRRAVVPRNCRGGRPGRHLLSAYITDGSPAHGPALMTAAALEC
jgi:hypothetical protein